jgi:hypothetical protein
MDDYWSKSDVMEEEKEESRGVEPETSEAMEENSEEKRGTKRSAKDRLGTRRVKMDRLVIHNRYLSLMIPPPPSCIITHICVEYSLVFPAIPFIPSCDSFILCFTSVLCIYCTVLNIHHRVCLSVSDLYQSPLFLSLSLFSRSLSFSVCLSLFLSLSVSPSVFVSLSIFLSLSCIATVFNVKILS